MLTEAETLPRLIADAVEPLAEIDDRTFGEFFEKAQRARILIAGVSAPFRS